MSEQSKDDQITEPKHTPGPWVVRGGVFIDAASTKQLAHLRGVESDPTTVANARLIAAAPELLTALKHLDSAVRGLEGLIPSNDGYLRLRLLQSAAAIAKAEGGAK